MTDPSPNRPLWELMDNSYGTHLSNEESYAAMIRAIADWIEQRNGNRIASIATGARVVVEQLRIEADRVEAGE